VLEELAVLEDELAEGVCADCCSELVVDVEPVVFPWVVSAATNENSPAKPTAPVIIQRLIRESSLRPRSRGVELGGVMTPRVGARRGRVLSPR
jgi:hypothetical protein